MPSFGSAAPSGHPDAVVEEVAAAAVVEKAAAAAVVEEAAAAVVEEDEAMVLAVAEGRQTWC